MKRRNFLKGVMTFFAGSLLVRINSQVVAIDSTLLPKRPARNKLPVAVIDSTRASQLQNPEILTWKRVSPTKEEGRGWIWVEEDNPLLVLDFKNFEEPNRVWGARRIAMARNNGRYGPLIDETNCKG